MRLMVRHPIGCLLILFGGFMMYLFYMTMNHDDKALAYVAFIFMMLVGAVLLTPWPLSPRQGIGLMFLILGLPVLLQAFASSVYLQPGTSREAANNAVLLFVLVGLGLLCWPRRSQRVPQSRQAGPGDAQGQGLYRRDALQAAVPGVLQRF